MYYVYVPCLLLLCLSFLFPTYSSRLYVCLPQPQQTPSMSARFGARTGRWHENYVCALYACSNSALLYFSLYMYVPAQYTLCVSSKPSYVPGRKEGLLILCICHHAIIYLQMKNGMLFALRHFCLLAFRFVWAFLHFPNISHIMTMYSIYMPSSHICPLSLSPSLSIYIYIYIMLLLSLSSLFSICCFGRRRTVEVLVCNNNVLFVLYAFCVLRRARCLHARLFTRV